MSLIEHVQSPEFEQWLRDCKPHEVTYYHEGSTFFLWLQNDITNPFNGEVPYPVPDLNRLLNK